MTITRIARRSPFPSPWREMEDMSNRLNRLFEKPVNGGSGWTPAVNVEESKEELILTAELPGMSIEDLEIEVENNVLSLQGEKKEEREEGDERRYHPWERSYGSFRRSFTLPRTVKTDKISAQFKDGVLHLSMPKAPEAKSRKIEISSQG